MRVALAVTARLLAPALVAGIAGCVTEFPAPASVPEKIVEAARSEPMIAGNAMTCSSPIALARDCADLRSPIVRRLLSLSGIPVRVAGSADGRVVVVATGHSRSALGRLDLTYSPANAQAFEATTSALRNAGLEPLRVRAIVIGQATGAFAVVGYVVEFEGDAYAELLAVAARPE